MMVRAAAIVLAALLLSIQVAEACSGCGCRGGPGYRGPNGKCVGWKQLTKVCGSPPTLRCTNERPGTDGDKKPAPRR